MKRHKNLTGMIILLIAFILLPVRNAHAYLDPGSGSYLIQIILAFVFGSLFFIKQIFFKIKVFILKLASNKKNKKDS